MDRCGRYIFGQLLGPTVSVTAGLTAVVWLTQSLRFVDLIINKGLAIDTFLRLTVLLLPAYVWLILPVGLFCAILYVYNRLIQESEIVVMRAAGLSQRRLALPALILAVLVALLCYVISLYLFPLSHISFKRLQEDVRNNSFAILLQEDVFNNPMRGLTVFIRERERDGTLRGILVHDGRVSDRPVTVMAERGALVNTSEGPKIVLSNGNRQEIDPSRKQLSLLYFERYSIDLAAFGATSDRTLREANERFVHELFDPPDVSQKYWNEYRAEAHKRLTIPLNALAFAALALWALLAGDFNRRGQWRHITATALAAIVYQAAQLGFASMSAREPAMAPLMYALPAAVIGLGLYFTSEPRWRPRRRAAPGRA